MQITLGQQYNVGEKPTVILSVRLHLYVFKSELINCLFKKNLNASKPSEHPPQVEECLKV